MVKLAVNATGKKKEGQEEIKSQRHRGEQEEEEEENGNAGSTRLSVHTREMLLVPTPFVITNMKQAPEVFNRWWEPVSKWLPVHYTKNMDGKLIVVLKCGVHLVLNPVTKMILESSKEARQKEGIQTWYLSEHCKVSFNARDNHRIIRVSLIGSLELVWNHEHKKWSMYAVHTVIHKQVSSKETPSRLHGLLPQHQVLRDVGGVWALMGSIKPEHRKSMLEQYPHKYDSTRDDVHVPRGVMHEIELFQALPLAGIMPGTYMTDNDSIFVKSSSATADSDDEVYSIGHLKHLVVVPERGDKPPPTAKNLVFIDNYPVEIDFASLETKIDTGKYALSFDDSRGGVYSLDIHTQAITRTEHDRKKVTYYPVEVLLNQSRIDWWFWQALVGDSEGGSQLHPPPIEHPYVFKVPTIRGELGAVLVVGTQAMILNRSLRFNTRWPHLAILRFHHRGRVTIEEPRTHHRDICSRALFGKHHEKHSKHGNMCNDSIEDVRIKTAFLQLHYSTRCYVY